MDFGEFRTSEPAWIEELRDRAETRGYSRRTEPVSRNSWRFEISSDDRCILGKLHHSRHAEKVNVLTAWEEIEWITQRQEQSSSEDNTVEVVEILSVIIDHQSPEEYNSHQDDFLVLPEEILEKLPDSGRKDIRSTNSGYVYPFDQHVNSWSRIFKNL